MTDHIHSSFALCECECVRGEGMELLLLSLIQDPNHQTKHILSVSVRSVTVSEECEMCEEYSDISLFNSIQYSDSIMSICHHSPLHVCTCAQTITVFASYSLV